MSNKSLKLSKLVDRYRFAELEPQSVVPPGSTVELVAATDEQLSDAQGALVLGIGIHDPDEALQEIERWGRAGATAIVLRHGALPEEAPLAALLSTAPIVVLTLGGGMPWLRFSALVVAELESSAAPPVDYSGRAQSELFDLADSIAVLVDGPVTIEDLASRILAFSSDQNRADEPRQIAILEREIPAANTAILREEGAFDRLYASAEPVFLPSSAIKNMRPRVVMRIQAGKELLGSIWAVVEEPLSPLQAKGMQELASIVALVLMRRRLTEEAYHQARVSLATRFISGGSSAAAAALELGIADAPTFAIAIRRGLGTEWDPSTLHSQRSLARSLSTFVTSVNPQSVVAEVDGTIYVVAALRRRAKASVPFRYDEDARRFAEGLLRHVSREGALIGYGEVVEDITQLARSRRQADIAVRVCQASGGRTPVLAWRDAQVESLLIELTDAMLARHEGIAHPLSRVFEAEQRTGLVLVETLSAYLEHLGDVTSAAASLFVHPNTFRYRLRKIAAEAQVDLSDRQTRFELLLQLRLHKRQSPGTSSGVV